MGYMVIDRIKNAYNLEYKTNRNCEYTKAKINGKEVVLLKPLTYMNLSGKAVIELKNFYKIPDNKIIVIYDDKDTLPGKIRIRKNGASGGHNGIKDILNYTKQFVRIRVGIGLPKFDMITHVISKVKDEEEFKLLESGTIKAEKAVYEILKNGVDISMNKFNQKEKSKEKEINKESVETLGFNKETKEEN